MNETSEWLDGEDKNLEAAVVAWARDHIADVRRVALADTECELSAAVLRAIDDYYPPADFDWSRL